MNAYCFLSSLLESTVSTLLESQGEAELATATHQLALTSFSLHRLSNWDAAF